MSQYIPKILLQFLITVRNYCLKITTLLFNQRSLFNTTFNSAPTPVQNFESVLDISAQ